MKLSSRDILDILRRFEVANETNLPRNVENIKFSHPNPINTLVSFSFLKNKLYLLFDDTAEDNPDYLISQLGPLRASLSPFLVKNPKDTSLTYAVPYRGKDLYLFEVLSSKKRLDSELVNRFPNYSRSIWQKYIKAGYVMVNGKIASSSKQSVNENDKICYNLPKLNDYKALEIPIIYIDDNVIVVDKPSGILTHSKGLLNDEFTVADFFRRYTTFNKDTNRPGIVHRLDRDTSGVIIGARNEETAKILQKQFANRKTKKIYYAILDGKPNIDKANIDLPISRSPSKPSTFRVDNSGKSAFTKYELLASDGKNSLVKFQPTTGRTHQLRVHMNYLNTPIHGDKIYGKNDTRLLLHAYSLEITIPDGQRKTFVSPVPADITNYFPKANLT